MDAERPSWENVMKLINIIQNPDGTETLVYADGSTKTIGTDGNDVIEFTEGIFTLDENLAITNSNTVFKGQGVGVTIFTIDSGLDTATQPLIANASNSRTNDDIDVTSDTGNKGLRDGIFMTILRKLG